MYSIPVIQYWNTLVQGPCFAQGSVTCSSSQSPIYLCTLWCSAHDTFTFNMSILFTIISKQCQHVLEDPSISPTDWISIPPPLPLLVLKSPTPLLA